MFLRCALSIVTKSKKRQEESDVSDKPPKTEGKREKKILLLRLMERRKVLSLRREKASLKKGLNILPGDWGLSVREQNEISDGENILLKASVNNFAKE